MLYSFSSAPRVVDPGGCAGGRQGVRANGGAGHAAGIRMERDFEGVIQLDALDVPAPDEFQVEAPPGETVNRASHAGEVVIAPEAGSRLRSIGGEQTRAVPRLGIE